MKRILMVPVLVLTIFSALSQQRQEGKLSISTTGNNKILAVIGETQYFMEDRDLTFRQLLAGTYTVKIFRLIRNDLPANEWKSFKNIFQQDIIVKNGVHTEITINRFGQCCINQMNVATYNSNDEWNEDLYVNNDPWLKSSANTSTQGQRIPNVMSNESFGEFKRLMKDQFYDTKMVSFFSNNIKNNLVSVQQVKELCQLLFYDKYKLELAKYAYDFTADKGNYFMLYSVFFYDTYKRDLELYIKNK